MRHIHPFFATLGVLVAIAAATPGSLARRDAGQRSEERISFTAHVEQFGQLRNVIGDRLTYIDSLTVIGPVDSTDFYTMYQCALHGCLRALNLENARLDRDEVPDNAFYRELEYDNRLPNLRRVILPNGTRRIGVDAFFDSNIEHVNLPESLEEIGMSAFGYANLKGRLVIPPKITRISVGAFSTNTELEEIVFHTGIEEICSGAFRNLYSLRRLELPEGLRILGGEAFAYTKMLEYLYIPSTLDSVVPRDGGGSFKGYSNCPIKQVKIADGIKRIPQKLFLDIPVSWLTLPESVTEIGPYGCNSKHIKGITLPANLNAIGETGLPYYLKTVIFPASIQNLGAGLFWNIRTIYCLNPEPPRAVSLSVSDEDLEAGNYILDDCSFWNAKNNPTVYIPRGSLQKYERKPYNKGWEFFTNFIELDEMPSLDAGVGEIKTEGRDNIRIFPIGGGVMIETSADRTPYSIHTVDGRLYAQGTVCAGNIHIPLPEGIYIVRAGTKTSKVII